MLATIRRRITFANVAMTVVLVFAMSGGAYAAGKYLITSTKQISPKVLKSLQGKAGKDGAPGASGAAGPVGPAGAVGPQGPAGAPGAKGETGAEGKEGKAGKDGKAGAAGSPWSVGGTLPPGKTETGVWAFGEVKQAGTQVLAVASFPIELAAPLPPAHGHYINGEGLEVNIEEEEVPSTACKGTAEAPTAEPGNLCIYAHPNFVKKAFIGSAGIENIVGRTGATMNIGAELGAEGAGTWAVTAE
jgi:hypothetical protein